MTKRKFRSLCRPPFSAFQTPRARCSGLIVQFATLCVADGSYFRSQNEAENNASALFFVIKQCDLHDKSSPAPSVGRLAPGPLRAQKFSPDSCQSIENNGPATTFKRSTTPQVMFPMFFHFDLSRSWIHHLVRHEVCLRPWFDGGTAHPGNAVHANAPV